MPRLLSILLRDRYRPECRDTTPRSSRRKVATVLRDCSGCRARLPGGRDRLCAFKAPPIGFGSGARVRLRSCLARLLPSARLVFGIDTSLPSLRAARRQQEARVAAMNAVSLGFGNAVFDVVVCIQNGVSAFAVDPAVLFREAVRVTRPGGTVLSPRMRSRSGPTGCRGSRSRPPTA